MLPESFEKLIREFSRLPGIGPRSAERIAMHLFKRKNGSLHSLSDAILHLRDNLKFCAECFYLSDHELCRMCADESRDKKTFCVVETVMDVVAVEKTGTYRGLYHVLHGKIAPIKKMEPDDLRIAELQKRIKREAPQEIIIATNADAEGEVTALYLQKLLKPTKIKLTRIARGIPVGGDLKFADDITLRRALEGRTVLD